MKKLHFTIIPLFIVFFVLTACHKGNNNMDITTDVQQFEAVWHELNDTYLLWSIDTTDWDAVYSKYHPLFEQMDDKTDFYWESQWIELTSTLLDHHLTIDLKRPSSSCSLFLNPSKAEVRSRNYWHSFIVSHDLVLNNLVDSNRLTDTVTTTIEWKNGNVVSERNFFSGILDQTIAYIYIPFFGLLLDETEAFVHFKELVARENVKAAIVDVRDNNGGDANNIKRVLSCFTTKPVLIGYSRTKLGLGKYDLSPKVEAIVDPSPDSQDRNIPIIVLTSISSMSAAETVPIALRHLPNCYLVGERTYGAICASNDYTVEKEGNGYVIKTAKLWLEDVDGTIYEGHGVEPDVECLFNILLWNSGVDNQLEKAVSVAMDKIATSPN